MSLIDRPFAHIVAAAALSLCLGLCATSAPAQSPEHVAAAKAFLEKSPVRGNCAPAQEDFLGWPAKLVQRCEYQREDMPGLAYVLDVPPEILARWVETGCSAHMASAAARCFDQVLKCALGGTGSAFVVGGDLIATVKGVKQNRFYRNGVAIVAPKSGMPGAVPIAEQEPIAHIPEKDVSGMLDRGGVAFWSTMPYQFAVKAIDLGVPAEMNTPDRREKWLEIVRVEMLKALESPENRFLSGWMSAHPITLRAGECPDERDP
ncbi:hypothetical protein [Methylocystis sp. B8]|uniref:hypothetical protein n=1 Tax=Methylocystis sp. B8 TaxID=544938 RepID=UPI0010FE7758|nr:hypothetical protein [Methylocystis sp. B8]TLG78063.1 hypothetical protein FEV16_05735 [Methylocystis sp. B8]